MGFGVEGVGFGLRVEGSSKWRPEGLRVEGFLGVQSPRKGEGGLVYLVYWCLGATGSWRVVYNCRDTSLVIIRVAHHLPPEAGPYTLNPKL